MKNRNLIVSGISIIAIIGVIGFLIYQPNDDLPIPTQETLDKVNGELKDLSLEESIRKIHKDKKEFDFILSFSSNSSEMYRDRESITGNQVRTIPGFSILTVDEYEKAYHLYINSLQFKQKIIYPNSILSIFPDAAIEDVSPKEAPKLTITKIVYKNGSYDDNPIKYKQPVELKTSKLIDYINVSAEYSYISEFDTYKIDKKNPTIKTDKFEIVLNKLSQNYASFSAFGDVKIAGYNVLNAQNKVLSFYRRSSYGVGYQEIINKYISGIDDVSKNKFIDKSELVYQIARYNQKMEDELDREFEIKYEGLYRGNTNSINIYSLIQFKKNEASVKINSSISDEFIEVINEDNQTWGLVGKDGKFIIMDLPATLKRLSGNYFYQDKLNDIGEGKRYDLLKFDNNLKRLVKQTEFDNIRIVDSNNFIIKKDNAFYFYNNGNNESSVIQLAPKSGDIYNIDFHAYKNKEESTGFFYIKDDRTYYIYNQEGKLILPPDRYDVERFNEGILQVKPDFFIIRELKPEDKYFHYIYLDGAPTLTINNYDYANGVSNGLILVNKDKKYGFVDLTGEIVIPLEYDKAYDFSEGYAYVEKNNLQGLIDTKGNVVIPLKYEDLGGNSTTNGIRYYNFKDKRYNARELIEAINTEK